MYPDKSKIIGLKALNLKIIIKYNDIGIKSNKETFLCINIKPKKIPNKKNLYFFFGKSKKNIKKINNILKYKDSDQ